MGKVSGDVEFQRGEKLKGNVEFLAELVVEVHSFLVAEDLRRDIEGEIILRAGSQVYCLLEDFLPVEGLVERNELSK